MVLDGKRFMGHLLWCFQLNSSVARVRKLSTHLRLRDMSLMEWMRVGFLFSDWPALAAKC